MKKIKRVRYISDDSGNCRKYYRGIEDNRLYCTVEWKNNIDWLVCEKSGEPSHSVLEYYNFEIVV